VAARKYDPGYSFRASEVLSQRDGERRTRQPAPGPPPELGGDEGAQNDCAQGNWCHAATRTDDGEWHPAKTWQAYCPSCRSVIANHLEDLPFACVRLLVQIGDRPRTGKAIRIPFGPREPIRLEIDALVREMALVLGSWHERVAAVARLSPPDTQDAARHPVETVRDARKVLSAHLDALLALPREPVVRILHSPGAAEEWLDEAGHEDAGIVRGSGEAVLMPELDGADAGREIIRLHRRARSILGEIRARAEAFDGIPCRSCEAMSLERAEPPSDPRQKAMKSRCADCGDVMDDETFDAWVSHYHGWASAASAGLVCRRCQRGNHAICMWVPCSCRAAGHAENPAA
jgi:hypothetical protein